MKRLIKKKDGKFILNIPANSGQGLIYAKLREVAEKLGKREDIEEDIGIDLVTLFNAFKNGIWSKGGFYGACCLDNEPHFIEPKDLELGFDFYFEVKNNNDEAYIRESDVLCLYTHDYENKEYSVRVKDYGKTWALTKEELNNE